MDKLESMQAFVAVARAGGFSAAARELGVPVPTLSRRVADLEAALGVRLFERSTRQVVLTDQAQAYFTACRQMLDDLREADEVVSGEHLLPKGDLSITAPVGFGRMHLQPIAFEFLREYSQVNLRLQLVDRLVNLLDEQVDAAVRISALPDSSMTARHLGEVRMVVCASRRYLDQHGTPQHPSQLIDHSCIAWASLGPLKSWLFREGEQETMFPIRTRLTVTLPESAVDAAIDGFGLTQVTSYQAAAAVRSGYLVPVLREFEAAPTPVSLVYPSGRAATGKLRTFLEFCGPRLSEVLKSVREVL